MKKDHFLDRFLSAVDSGENPTDEDLRAVADALRKQKDENKPFLTAFDYKKNPGRKRQQTIGKLSKKQFPIVEEIIQRIDKHGGEDKAPITKIINDVADKYGEKRKTVEGYYRSHKEHVRTTQRITGAANVGNVIKSWRERLHQLEERTKEFLDREKERAEKK